MRAQGKFSITLHPELPYDAQDGLSFGRVRVEKVFEGPLTGTSRVDMTTVATPTPGAQAYVAVERFVGALEGRRGSFAMIHLGVMNSAGVELSVRIVPGSGLGELAGITGTVSIQIREGQHYYELDYQG